MEALNTIFKENSLELDMNDHRLDSVADISSSDDDIRKIVKDRDYIYSKSKSSF